LTMTRNDLFTAFKAAVVALQLVKTGTDDRVTEWDGEEATFNQDAEFPSIQIEYSGDVPEAPEGIRQVEYQRNHVFALYVNTESGSAARSILDGLESGMQGRLTGTDRVVKRTGTTKLTSAFQGKYVYGIKFAVSDAFQKSF